MNILIPILNIIKGIWTWSLENINVIIGAIIGSTISGILIYYWTESRNNKKIIEALKKELETNKALLIHGAEQSLKTSKVTYVYFYFDSFSLARKSNLLIKRLGIELYNELIGIYNQLRLIDRFMVSIELGLRGYKDPNEFAEGWKGLANHIAEVIKKIK